MPFWGRGYDHIGNFNFKVEIEGVAAGQFKAVEGLGSETEVIEFGGTTDTIRRKRPGRHKYTDITLKKGFTNTDALWKWRKAVVDGMVDRRSGSIILCADNGQEVMRYNFFEAWPTKWKGFTLDGKGADVDVEELTITTEKIERG